jgi:hypothetical protein
MRPALFCMSCYNTLVVSVCLQDAARGITSISREAGLEVDEEEYLGSFVCPASLRML